MAEGWRFVCDHCGFEIVAWSDGNPYIVGQKGLPPRGNWGGNEQRVSQNYCVWIISALTAAR